MQELWVICKALDKQADIVWQTFRILLVKHAYAFGHHEIHCFMRTFCLSTFLKLFKKHFLIVTSKNYLSSTCLCSGQTANTVLDKQNLKYWPNNVCPFGQGLTDMIVKWLQMPLL